MKKLALAFMAVAATIFGVSMVAEAQYPTALSVGTVTAGGPYTATYTNCTVGDTITFTQPQSTPTSGTAPCQPAAATLTGSIIGVLLPAQTAQGSASFNFSAAPTAAGTYTVNAVGANSPQVSTQFTIAATTPPPATNGGGEGAGGGGLPATGSSGLNTTTSIAIGLLLVGIGLFAVAHFRRRNIATA